jgi:hypothetical protein
VNGGIKLMAKIVKVFLIGKVHTIQIQIQWAVERTLEQLKDAVLILDEYGKAYKHDSPWKDEYFEDPEYYLFRVKVGAIGRINNCRQAALLGAIPRINASTYHFTSMALYYVFRVARLNTRQYKNYRDIEKWIGSLNKKSSANSRFLEYENIGVEETS